MLYKLWEFYAYIKYERYDSLPTINSLSERKKKDKYYLHSFKCIFKALHAFFFFFKMNISPEHNSLVAEKENSNIAE